MHGRLPQDPVPAANGGGRTLHAALQGYGQVRDSHSDHNLRAHVTYQVLSLSFRSYYENNDLAAALGIIEEALDRHPELVSDDFVNMAAELNIASHYYSKALQVQFHLCDQHSIPQ